MVATSVARAGCPRGSGSSVTTGASPGADATLGDFLEPYNSAWRGIRRDLPRVAFTVFGFDTYVPFDRRILVFVAVTVALPRAAATGRSSPRVAELVLDPARPRARTSLTRYLAVSVAGGLRLGLVRDNRARD